MTLDMSHGTTPLEELLAAHPLRSAGGDKDDRGTVLLIGGPPTCPGAIVLAGEAALRTGAGRIQLVLDPATADSVAAAVPEAFVSRWDLRGPPGDEVATRIRRADVVVIGPGYSSGVVEEAVGFVAPLTDGSPLVLDAGALPAALRVPDGLPLVVAPNPSEAAELLGREGTVGDLAAALADRLGRPVAVRGRTTVVADPGGTRWEHADGADGLGTAGSGDVLVGALGAFLARGLPTVAALGWAVAVHGRAGRLLGRTMPLGYLAREIAAHLPIALAELTAD